MSNAVVESNEGHEPIAGDDTNGSMHQMTTNTSMMRANTSFAQNESMGGRKATELLTDEELTDLQRQTEKLQRPLYTPKPRAVSNTESRASLLSLAFLFYFQTTMNKAAKLDSLMEPQDLAPCWVTTSQKRRPRNSPRSGMKR